MPNSNIRTVAIRVSPDEHRLLRSFAAAHGVAVEALIRETLSFAPIDVPIDDRHDRLVQRERTYAACEPGLGRVASV